LKALALAREWWNLGLTIQVETRGTNLKKALTSANRQGIQLALLLGDGELEKKTVSVKNLSTGSQEEWPLEEVPSRLRS